MPTWLTPNGSSSKSTVSKIAFIQVLILLGIWVMAPQPIPTPQEVLAAWASLLGNGLLWELRVSFVTNLEAILLSAIISIFIAYLTVLPAMRSVATAVASARYFGVTGFVVLFTLSFGAGQGLRIALLTFCIVPFFVSSLVAIVAAIPREEWNHARALRLSPWRSVWEVVVLGRADQALDSLRQNASIGWMALTMVEGLSRSEGGIGVMMLDQNKHFNLASVFAIQGTIFILGVFQDFILAKLRQVACPYADLSLERK